MPPEKESQASPILPVQRSHKEARQLYDRVSSLYDFVAGAFERKHADTGLERLSIQSGEAVLEICFGSGYCLQRIAQSVGAKGRACGIDISPGMLQVARRRLEKAGLTDRVGLFCGDAVKLPYRENSFNAVFISFALELFDNAEIPQVLGEVRRVLKPEGRLGIVSMSRDYGEPVILRLYEWAHNRWPKYLDCRPISVERSLVDAGYQIQSREMARMIGLPIEIVVASKG